MVIVRRSTTHFGKHEYILDIVRARVNLPPVDVLLRLERDAWSTVK